MLLLTRVSQPTYPLGIDVKDGSLINKVPLLGPGRRFSRPLTIDDKLFVTTRDRHNEGPSYVEGFALLPRCDLQSPLRCPDPS